MVLSSDSAKKIKWPEQLSEKIKNDLLACATTIRITNEKELTGKYYNNVLYVLNGTLTPCMLSQGVRTVTGVVFGEGVWFGDFSMGVSKHPYLHCEVVEPADIVVFPSKELAKIATTSNEVYRWLWRINIDMSARWLQAQIISGESIVNRLIYTLLDIAAHQGSSKQMSYPISVSQFQLSTMTAVSRSRVNEVLKELERDGSIEVTRSNISIIDFEKLGEKISGLDLSFRDPREIIKETNSHSRV